MIPYFEAPSLNLGFAEIHTFGVLVATGLIVALEVAQRRARKLGLDANVVFQFGIIAFIIGFIVAHLFHVFIYHPEEFAADPWSVFRIWSGISSFGGFVGAVTTGIVYLKIRKLSITVYGDVFAHGFVPGWFFGRCGCATAHDHQGRLSDFFLAIDFPEGARHDLGLYEALIMLSLTIAFIILGRRPRFPGFYLALLSCYYGLWRFFLDFLRADDLSYVDARYAGLTPAQYGSLLVVGTGVALFVVQHRKPPWTPSKGGDPQAKTPKTSEAKTGS